MHDMAEPPAQLSAAALRMAGHVGQTALDRIAGGGIAAAAALDQHVAAVRAELAICQQLPSSHSRRAGQRSQADDLLTRLALLRSAKAMCPDVPFVSDAFQGEVNMPVTLLLHYASGFVEAGIKSGWWPGKSADATDWVSLRLAAICKLIGQAEAAAQAHPDLRASA